MATAMAAAFPAMLALGLAVAALPAAAENAVRIPVPPVAPSPGGITTQSLLLDGRADAVANALRSSPTTETTPLQDVELFLNPDDPGCSIAINAAAVDGSRNDIEQNIFAPVTVICR